MTIRMIPAITGFARFPVQITAYTAKRAAVKTTHIIMRKLVGTLKKSLNFCFIVFSVKNKSIICGKNYLTPRPENVSESPATERIIRKNVKLIKSMMTASTVMLIISGLFVPLLRL